MMYAVIIACEIGFWVVILAGLAARYLLGRRRLGAVLMACVPLVDLVLLVATVIDLRRGGQAELVHGLAASTWASRLRSGMAWCVGRMPGSRTGSRALRPPNRRRSPARRALATNASTGGDISLPGRSAARC